MPWAPHLKQVPSRREGPLHWSICCLQGFCTNRNPPRSFPDSIRYLLRCHLRVATPTLPLYLILSGLPPTTLISSFPWPIFPFISHNACCWRAGQWVPFLSLPPQQTQGSSKLACSAHNPLLHQPPHTDRYLVTLRGPPPAHLSPGQDWGHELCKPSPWSSPAVPS